ncbi:MAG: CoA transferase subunit A [Clostridia bacterium]|nr:CoA transferase subunit A [Clostridia bacterium]
MINKVTTLENAMKDIKDGASIMVGGFLDSGRPSMLERRLADMGVRDLTIISMCTGTEKSELYRVFTQGQVSKIIASYIRFNPVSINMILNDPKKVTLLPMGTLTERIRAGGTGLGGILTAVGVGTLVEEGKQKINIDGRDYLLELPIRADFAIVHAYMADEMGNLVFRGTKRNFNAVMPYSADFVIAEAEHIVKAGEISPDDVIVPGIFVDAVVKVGD